jgi:hypothetical protein
MVRVVTLLASGCPVLLRVDERTVARWQERAGAHGHTVHEDQVLSGTRDLPHVHADEIRGKGWKMIPWIGLAMMVSTRLWKGERGQRAPGSHACDCRSDDGQGVVSAAGRRPGAHRWLGRVS